ncbi:hypothetical protein RCH33_2455 [Flavobacterium daejeonense]|nr:hypothetical protein RCH33_2455 [Flavobacterium daejeonense]
MTDEEAQDLKSKIHEYRKTIKVHEYFFVSFLIKQKRKLQFIILNKLTSLAS